MKLKSKIISALLVLVLLVSSFTSAGIKHASAAVNVPELLITEVMPKSQDNDDPYEYVELYNNSDIYIDLKNYKFVSPNINIASSNVIPPRGIMVICMRSNTSLYDFNRFYGTNLTAINYMTLPNTSNVLDNSLQNIWLTKDDGTVISMAKYESQDFGLKQTVTYKYPENGFEMIRLGQKQLPTPGTITADQVPDYGTKVAGITLNETFVKMGIGSAKALTAAITPSTATNKNIIWTSSNPNIAVVNSNGIVTAKAEGYTIITAASAENSNIYDTCTIQVAATNIPVTGITLNPTSAYIGVNQATVLTAAVLPELATNKQVIWSSSNTAVATVDNNGIVFGKNAGTATITAKTADGGYTAACIITVYNSNGYIYVTGVSLDKKEISIEPNKAFVLTATVSPENATNKNITWTSSNSNIAVVDTYGIVYTKALGTATITATAEGNHSASCVVTVTNTPTSRIPVTGVKLDKQALIMKLQETKTLSAKVIPSDATNKKVIWQSDNPVCVSVDQTGKLTALKAGIATITVKTEEGNYTAKCIVVVIGGNIDCDNEDHLIVSIKMNKTALKLKDHQKYTLKAIVTPGIGRIKQLIWKSSNTSVATVDNNGTVTPKRTGTVTITASTPDGKLSCQCTVTVYMNNGKGKGKK